MIAVIDSGVANLASVMAALHRLGADAVVTADPAIIATADRVILPGVGAAAPAMAQLERKGLTETIRGLTRPTLGICLGMQLLFDSSTESGGTRCLGIVPGAVEQLHAAPLHPVPHMGWNQLAPVASAHPLLHDIAAGDFVYFVHSFAAPVSASTVAKTSYGSDFTAIAAQGNFMGCQFHPERSGKIGSRILQNFLNL